MRKRFLQQACGVAVSCFILLMLITPKIPQPQKYHDFADKCEFFGNCIPDTLNVISSFPFLVIGVIGLMFFQHRNYFKLSLQGELCGWTCFYVSVAATAFGSSYYHLKPDHDRRVWNRLPMATAFASLFAILIIQRIDAKKETLSIIPLNMAGIMNIVYWRYYDDIRVYGLVQFVSTIAIPLMAILLPPMYTHSMGFRVYLNTCSISQTTVEEGI